MINNTINNKNFQSESFIIKLVMDDFYKKNGFINFKNGITSPTINTIINKQISKSIQQKISTSSSSSDLDSPNLLINKSDSYQSINSFQSISTEISDDSPISSNKKNGEYTNLFLKNLIFNTEESPINYDDSETITDTNTIINLKKDKIDENNKNTENKTILKSFSNKNIYEPKSEDFLILSNLILLSKLEPNQKIFVSHSEKSNKDSQISFELKIDNSYLPKLTRWYYKQNRNETIWALNKLIDVAIYQYEVHIKLENSVEQKKYMDLFVDILKGLKNLKITYKTDKLTADEIDLIILKINNLVYKK